MGGARISEGEIFGQLTAVRMTYKISKSGRKRSHWVCICSCGLETTVDSGNLRNGNTQKCCSCAIDSRASHRTTHGQTRGRKPTKAYMTWCGIKARVHNTSDARFADYGGRGIDMSPSWFESFDQFYLDMGHPPSRHHQIDRVDNDKGYWPDNCEWATRQVQGNNKRNNILICFEGKTKTLTEWCIERRLNYEAAKKRYYKYPDRPDLVLSKTGLPKGPNPHKRWKTP